MRRRHSRSAAIFGNPVLIGSVTVLVAVVAVFLAYNANRGLPFVPTTKVKVVLPNGANLLPGNEVREGGFRIGIVDEMNPVTLPDGTTAAEVELKLDKKAGTIPEDSVVTVRPLSVLGLKFVELTRGTSPGHIEDGGTLPSSQARIPVELDQYLDTFDAPTRRNVQRALHGFGDALAYRGTSVNDTLGLLPVLLGHLEPVTRTLADRRRTDLPRFVSELADAARVVAPIASVLSRQFTVAADVFAAWASDPEALRETLRLTPATLDAGITSFREQRPFLADLAALGRSLRVATDKLEFALTRVTPALQVGPPVLRRVPEVSDELTDVLRSARRLFEDPRTSIALRGLSATTATLNPTLRFLGPYITVCNYWNYAWTNAGEHITEPDPTGNGQRTQLGIPSTQDNSVGALGARRPANGENVTKGTPTFLHVNVYSAAIDTKGNADCESGQRGFIRRAATYAPEDLQIVIDPRIPGNQGTTFSGRPRVLPGQTFSRTPELGPSFPMELDTP